MTTLVETSSRQITGDVTSDAGKLNVAGDLNVSGSVGDNVDIKSTGTLNVGGAVEAATIDVLGKVQVAGGILGKNKGRVSSEQGVAAKFCSGANIICSGDVEMQTECVQSEVSARGAVKIPEGIISGGRVLGNGGIICKTLGSPAGAATEVGAGFHRTFDETVIQELARLKTILDRAKDIKSKVEPLMKNQKSLTPQQKEKAIELLYEASEQEQAAQAAIAALKRNIADVDAHAKAEIVVTGVVHANVTVRFRGFEATIKQSIKGPVKFSLATTQSPTAICIAEINQDGKGGVFYLEATPHSDPTLEARITLAKLA